MMIQKKILNHHVDNINKMCYRLNNNSNIKCTINKCQKNALYKINDKYVCWFHRIDLNINNNINF